MSEIISCNSMFNFVAGLSASSANSVTTAWEQVVSKIHTSRDDENNEKHISIGERLAYNTRVIDLKNGVLLVETDHPGWIQYLKIYQKFILKGLNMSLPQMEIKSLAFRLTGTNAVLSETYEISVEKAKEKLGEVWNREEKIIEQKFGTQNNKEEAKLPPELLEKFESIRQSIKESNKEG